MKPEFSTFSTIGVFGKGENGWENGYTVAVKGIQNMLSKFSHMRAGCASCGDVRKNDETIL